MRVRSAGAGACELERAGWRVRVGACGLEPHLADALAHPLAEEQRDVEGLEGGEGPEQLEEEEEEEERVGAGERQVREVLAEQVSEDAVVAALAPKDRPLGAQQVERDLWNSPQRGREQSAGRACTSTALGATQRVGRQTCMEMMAVDSSERVRA